MSIPSFRTPQAFTIVFLVLSFLLFLALPRQENTHPLRSPLNTIHSLTNFRPPKTSRAIHIFQTKNRVLCRVYRACLLPSGVLHLPKCMRSHANLLRTQCGLSNILFSKFPPSNNSFWINQNDLIAPNIPYKYLHDYVRSYMSSFLISNPAQLIKRTCISPCTIHDRHISHTCQSNSELPISNPAIILDQGSLEASEAQPFIRLLNQTFQNVFATSIKFLSTTETDMSTGNICFRSVITSPALRSIPFSDRSLALRKPTGDVDTNDSTSILSSIFARIGVELQQTFINISHVNNHSQKSIADDDVSNNSHRQVSAPNFGNFTEQLSDSKKLIGQVSTKNTTTVSVVNKHSARQLLSATTSPTNLNTTSSGAFTKRTASEIAANDKVMDDHVNGTATVGTLASSTPELVGNATVGVLGNVIVNVNATSETLTNNATHEEPATEVTRERIGNSSNTEASSYSMEGATAIHAELKRGHADINEDTYGDLLPTFSYLNEHPPKD